MSEWCRKLLLKLWAEIVHHGADKAIKSDPPSDSEHSQGNSSPQKAPGEGLHW